MRLQEILHKDYILKKYRPTFGEIGFVRSTFSLKFRIEDQ